MSIISTATAKNLDNTQKNPRTFARGFAISSSGGGCVGRRIASAVLDRIIHLEFDWMRRVLQRDDLFHLQVDIGIDLIVGKDIALRQEAAIGAERVQSLTQ